MRLKAWCAHCVPDCDPLQTINISMELEPPLFLDETENHKVPFWDHLPSGACCAGLAHLCPQVPLSCS